jgi:hypothetical protein
VKAAFTKRDSLFGKGYVNVRGRDPD